MKKIHTSIVTTENNRERIKVAKQIYVQIFQQIEQLKKDILGKNHKTDSDYENLEYLDCTKEELNLDHCFFIAWYLANNIGSEDNWYKLNLQLVDEVMVVFPLVKKHDVWKNIPLYHELFPTKSGIKLQHFLDYFKLFRFIYIEGIKSEYWNDPNDFDPDQFGIPFPKKEEDKKQ